MEKQKFSARVKQAIGEASITNLYQLNGMVPVHKAIPFGLQHILAMFVANIAPILIVGGACGLAASDMAMLIQSAMLIAGIGTLVQLFPIFHKIGSGLPIVMGISFTFVSVLCFIGANTAMERLWEPCSSAALWRAYWDFLRSSGSGSLPRSCPPAWSRRSAFRC